MACCALTMWLHLAKYDLPYWAHIHSHTCVRTHAYAYVYACVCAPMSIRGPSGPDLYQRNPPPYPPSQLPSQRALRKDMGVEAYNEILCDAMISYVMQ